MRKGWDRKKLRGRDERRSNKGEGEKKNGMKGEETIREEGVGLGSEKEDGEREQKSWNKGMREE